VKHGGVKLCNWNAAYTLFYSSPIIFNYIYLIRNAKRIIFYFRKWFVIYLIMFSECCHWPIVAYYCIVQFVEEFFILKVDNYWTYAYQRYSLVDKIDFNKLIAVILKFSFRIINSNAFYIESFCLECFTIFRYHWTDHYD